MNQTYTDYIWKFLNNKYPNMRDIPRQVSFGYHLYFGKQKFRKPSQIYPTWTPLVKIKGRVSFKVGMAWRKWQAELVLNCVYHINSQVIVSFFSNQRVFGPTRCFKPKQVSHVVHFQVICVTKYRGRYHTRFS